MRSLTISLVVLTVLFVAAILGVYFGIKANDSKQELQDALLSGSSLRVSVKTFTNYAHVEDLFSDEVGYGRSMVVLDSDTLPRLVVMAGSLADPSLKVRSMDESKLTFFNSTEDTHTYTWLSVDEPTAYGLKSNPSESHLVMFTNTRIHFVETAGFVSTYRYNITDGNVVDAWLTPTRLIYLDSTGTIYAGTYNKESGRLTQVPEVIVSDARAADVFDETVVYATSDGELHDVTSVGNSRTYRKVDVEATWGSKVTVSKNGLSIIISVPGYDGSSGGFWAMHRSTPGAQWLESLNQIQTRSSGSIASNQYSMAVRFVDTAYVLVGGLVSTDLDVWHLDPVVGVPTAFFSLDTGVHQAGDSLIFRELESLESRVLVATGSNPSTRSSSLNNGSVRIFEVSFTAETVEYDDYTAPSSLENYLFCASSRWSTTEQYAQSFNELSRLQNAELTSDNEGLTYIVRVSNGYAVCLRTLNNQGPDGIVGRHDTMKVIRLSDGNTITPLFENPDLSGFIATRRMAVSDSFIAIVTERSIYWYNTDTGVEVAVTSLGSNSVKCREVFFLDDKTTLVAHLVEGNPTTEGLYEFNTGGMIRKALELNSEVSFSPQSESIMTCDANGFFTVLTRSDGEWSILATVSTGYSDIESITADVSLMNIGFRRATDDLLFFRRNSLYATQFDDISSGFNHTVIDESSRYEKYYVYLSDRSTSNDFRNTPLSGDVNMHTNGTTLIESTDDGTFRVYTVSCLT